MWVSKPSHGWSLPATIRCTRRGHASATLPDYSGLLASSATHGRDGIPNSTSVKLVASPGWSLFHATSLTEPWGGLWWQGVVAAGAVVCCGMVRGSGVVGGGGAVDGGGVVGSGGVVGGGGLVAAGVVAGPH